jgi:hypothetical protein
MRVRSHFMEPSKTSEEELNRIAILGEASSTVGTCEGLMAIVYY